MPGSCAYGFAGPPRDKSDSASPARSFAPWAEAAAAAEVLPAPAPAPARSSLRLDDAATSVACTLAKWARARLEDEMLAWLRSGGGDEAANKEEEEEDEDDTGARAVSERE